MIDCPECGLAVRATGGRIAMHHDARHVYDADVPCPSGGGAYGFAPDGTFISTPHGLVEVIGPPEAVQFIARLYVSTRDAATLRGLPTVDGVRRRESWGGEQ